jgi:hypothetical protein
MYLYSITQISGSEYSHKTYKKQRKMQQLTKQQFFTSQGRDRKPFPLDEISLTLLNQRNSKQIDNKLNNRRRLSTSIPSLTSTPSRNHQEDRWRRRP